LNAIMLMAANLHPHTTRRQSFPSRGDRRHPDPGICESLTRIARHLLRPTQRTTIAPPTSSYAPALWQPPRIRTLRQSPDGQTIYTPTGVIIVAQPSRLSSSICCTNNAAHVLHAQGQTGNQSRPCRSVASVSRWARIFLPHTHLDQFSRAGVWHLTIPLR
jgi:hypothetical protein